jgi:hypothetical protein
MSRRARRKSRRSPAGTWLPRIAAALLFLAALLAVTGYILLRNYLHSEGFRLMLSRHAGSALKADGGFSPFRWDGLQVSTASYEASGEGLLRSLLAEDLRSEVHLSGVRRGVWELQGNSIRRLEAVMDLRENAPETTPPPPAKPKPSSPSQPSWLPDQVDPLDLILRELNLTTHTHAGPIRARGLRVDAVPGGSPNTHRAEIRGGRLSLPTSLIPELRLQHARIRHNRGQIYLTDAELSGWRKARIHATGEGDLSAGSFSLEGEITDLRCEEILSESWARRLTGDLRGTFSLRSHDNHPIARGRIELLNGVLTALPVLDVLAAYADTRRFRILTLHEASSDWHWQQGTLTCDRIVLASEGLVRLEGRLVVRGENLDGRFRLGIVPGALATIPGAETHVFLPGERGLLWSPLTIGGTLDDPTEDLSARLRAAAGLRLFETIPETGAQVLKFTRNILGETPAEATDKALRTLEKGTEMLDKGTEILRGAGSLIDSLLPPAPRQPAPPRSSPE